jgi:hypothetical protein
MKKQAVHTLASIMARTEDYGDCQVWTGYAPNKTPSLDYYGKMTSVRRVIAILSGREIKDEGFFAAKCGTDLCVCPEHIIQRSRAVHMRVMAKGAATGTVHTERIRKVTLTRRKQSAKLDMGKARDIRASEESGPVLAQRYGVNRSLINKVRANKAWIDTASPFAGLGARA